MAVGRSLLEALVSFAPIVFVFAIIVISRFGDADLEEVGIAEHGVGGCEPAAGMTVDRRSIGVDPAIAPRQFFHAGDLIGQRVVAHVRVVRVVKRLRSPRRPHPVDLDDDKPQLSERLCIAASGRE